MSGGGSPIVLHAVGDIGFGGRLRREAAPESGNDPFARAATALAGADILFGNLETPLVPEGREPVMPEIRSGFAGTPGHAHWLARHGFTIVSLANNHVMDYGIEGLRSTLEALRGEGILAVGAGESLSEARRGVPIEVRGRRIVLLAYANEGSHTAGESTPGAAPLREELIVEDLTRAASGAEAVVVSLHFGLVYSDYPREADQALARRLCAAGATAVLGHHPHVLQGFERSGGSLIAYSLGEILFDPASGHVVNRSAERIRREACVLRLEIAGGAVGAMTPRPTLRDDPTLHPVAVEGEAAGAISDRLARISEPLEGDGLGSAAIRGASEARTAGHQWNVFLHHLTHGHLGILFRWALRLRPRHLALAARAVRARLRQG